MKTFGIWLEMATPPAREDPYEAWEQWYLEVEPLIKDSAMQELAQTGSLTILGMEKRAGVSEGYANFLVREFLKRNKTAAHGTVAVSHQRKQEEEERANDKDQYLYHVTTKRRLPLIKKNGLSPTAPSQFSNYTDYSKGKVFFSEKQGVSFWKEKVEEHEHANNDRVSGVVVLRVKRELLEDGIQNDGRGTEDSRSPSYYITKKVPARAIEVVG